MRNLNDSVFGVMVSVSLIGVMAGCSSELQTTILSKDLPEESEVSQPQEPPISRSVPVVSESKISEKSLGIPSIDIPVEEPTRAVIRKGAPAKIFAAPREGALEPSPMPSPVKPSDMKPTDSQGTTIDTATVPGSQEFSRGIPPVIFEPVLPTEPTIRGESSQLVAKLEPESVPEPIQVPEEQEVFSRSQPEQSVEDSEVTDLEVAPPNKSEPQEEENPIEVAKVMPRTSEMPVTEGKEQLLKILEDVYFDYDRFSIREDAVQKLEANARVLAARLSSRHVVIEGHCDERGTQSYNMILGERRAKNVKEFLVDLGVPGDNLEVLSLGKEKPTCTDHTQACWQENRRGHFVVK